MEEIIKQKISSALEAANDIKDPTLKVAAFKVVLAHLLSMSGHDVGHVKKGGAVSTRGAPVNKMDKNISFRKTLPISDDELSEIYDIDGDVLGLHVKIKDGKTADQQRKLVHTILFGYKVMLDTREIAGSKILKVAKDWDVPTDHFVHNVGPSEYIQVRNTGKGKDPIYSLKPGALEKLCEEVKLLAIS